MKKSKHSSPRQMARSFAVQALYQWHHTQHPKETLFVHFAEEKQWPNTDQAYFQVLVAGALDNIEDVDATLRPFLDRDLEKLDPVELAVLRIAVYEFKYNPSVPYKVVINEALEICKRYGSVEGYKFINAVLDAVAVNLRAVEIKAK